MHGLTAGGQCADEAAQKQLSEPGRSGNVGSKFPRPSPHETVVPNLHVQPETVRYGTYRCACGVWFTVPSATGVTSDVAVL